MINKYSRVSARGAIVEHITATPQDAWHAAYAGEEGSFLVEGWLNADEFWFDKGWQTPRPALAADNARIAADGVEAFRLSVPSDGECVYLTGGRIGRVVVDISDGEFVFQTTVPGQYRFEFSCFPYRRQIITVTAHAVSD